MQDLDIRTPIIDPATGAPNNYFMRFLQERGIGQEDLEKALKLLLEKSVVPANPSVIVANGAFNEAGNIELSADLQWMLDQITDNWGDILFRGAAGWEALAPGTAGQVLSTNGAGMDPSWITPSGGGALPARTLIQPTANISRTNSSFTDLSFSSGDIRVDDVSAWASGAPSRLTTPPGYTKVRLTLQAIWASNSAGVRWNYLNANGAAAIVEDVRNAANEGASSLITPILTVTPGDYFTFVMAQTSGGSLNLIGAAGLLAVSTRIQAEWWS